MLETYREHVSKLIIGRWRDSLSGPLKDVKAALTNLCKEHAAQGDAPDFHLKEAKLILQGAEPDLRVWKDLRRSAGMKELMEKWQEMNTMVQAAPAVFKELQQDLEALFKAFDKEDVRFEANHVMGLCSFTQSASRPPPDGDSREATFLQTVKFWLDRDMDIPKGVTTFVQKNSK